MTTRSVRKQHQLLFLNPVFRPSMRTINVFVILQPFGCFLLFFHTKQPHRSKKVPTQSASRIALMRVDFDVAVA